MLDCNACTLRAIRAIAGDSLLARPPPRLLRTPRIPHRAASTAVTPTASNAIGEPYLNAAQIRHHRAKDNELVANEVSTAISAAEDRALKKELRWLQDPLKFAEHVHYTLRCDKPDKALALCRLASKEMSCVVAWNHVVDWHMRNNKFGDAIKIYNEMKKRAQFPDSYTYMMLLRGFVGVQNHDRKAEIKEENAARAVSIYNSMKSPTSRVTPTIMHTNAVLRVCSFAFDMDAFWGVASKIPDHGPGSADHITYTLIFQAIRHGTLSKRPQDMSREQLAMRGRQAVHDGKKVWQEVVQKWRSGEVKIDEALVCSMGRVLLLSPDLKDWDDVLSLIQQTMQIDRLAPPVGSPDRHTEHVPQLQLESPAASLSPTSQEDHEGYTSTPAGRVFKPIQPLPFDHTKPSRPKSLTHVTPGNDTLSVLTEACGLMRAPRTATAYWDLLTSPTHPYAVKPDLANFHAQLRLLRNNRASARAAQLLVDDLPRAGVQPKNMTFRMAMAVCARDKNNPHVLEHARAVVRVMEKSVPDPDVMTLKQYLAVALATDDGAKIVSALDGLDSLVHNLRSLVTYGNVDEHQQHQPREKGSGGVVPDGGGGEGATSPSRISLRAQVVEFFGLMIGTIDTLMNRGLVPREDFVHWHGRRSQLNSFLGRAKGRGERGEARRRSAAVVGDGGQSEVADGSGNGKEEAKMGKGSWELMMFRKRNARRRVSPSRSSPEPESESAGRGREKSAAWGPPHHARKAGWGEGRTAGGAGGGGEREDGRQRRRRGADGGGAGAVAFADSPAQLGG